MKKRISGIVFLCAPVFFQLGCKTAEVTTQPESSQIFGRVYDADDVPQAAVAVELIADGRVFAKSVSKSQDDPSTGTNEIGGFTIEAPAPADVKVQFSKSGFATKFYNLKTYTTTAGGNIALRALQQDATLVAADGSLTVKVIGVDGAGVANARVKLDHDNYDLSSGTAPAATGTPASTETPAATTTPPAATTPTTAPARAPGRFVTTGADGSVAFTGLPADDSFKVTVPGIDTNNDGVSDLEGGTKTVNLGKNSTARTGTVTIFANKAMGSTSLVVRVFAFGGPAFVKDKSKAKITLTNSGQSLFLEKEVDENGEAKFEGLPSTSGYSIFVSPYDQDADGNPDYKAKSVTGVALNTYSDTLQTIELEESSNTNFTVIYNSVGVDGAIAPGDNLDLVLSQEIVKETIDEPGTDLTLTDPNGSNVGFTVKLDEKGLRLTIDPTENLKENLPSVGSYTLTLTNLRSVQGLSLASGGTVTFRVQSGVAKLASPAPGLCSASVNCDTRSTLEINYNTTAPDLQWAGVAGATMYRLYAKDSNRNTNWVRLTTANATGAGTETSINLTLPTSFDSSPDATPQTPFADKTKVTFAVTAINAEGVEGDLDTTKVLDVTDGRPPCIAGETFNLSAAQSAVQGQDFTKLSGGNTANNTSIGAGSGTASASKLIEVRFSGFPEYMSTAANPAVSVTEEGATASCPSQTGNNAETLTVSGWTWGPGPQEGYVTVTVSGGKDNSGDCIVLKLDGVQDSSGNAELAITPQSDPTAKQLTNSAPASVGTAAALGIPFVSGTSGLGCGTGSTTTNAVATGFGCNGDRCVVQLQ